MATAQPLPFSALLRRHRLAAGLTQAELAERATLSVNAISALESGRRGRPFQHTVTHLADALLLSEAERTVFHAAARRQPSPLTTPSPTPALLAHWPPASRSQAVTT